MIINIKQTKTRKLMDFFITLLGWFFLLMFLYNLIINFHAKLNYHFYWLNLSNTNAVVLFTFLLLILCSASLVWWKFYNKRKYGPLNRRKFPSFVDNHEMAAYYQISDEEVKKIQEQRYVDID